MNYADYKMVRLTEAADVERAQRGKIYPAGSILIALSANSGRMEYLETAGEVDSQWAVAVPKTEYEPWYLYYSVLSRYPKFLHKYMTGINLTEDALKYFFIPVHPREIQKEIVRSFALVEQMERKEEKELEHWKGAKKSYQGRMLLTNLPPPRQEQT